MDGEPRFGISVVTCTVHSRTYKNANLAALDAQAIRRLSPVLLNTLHEMEFPGTPVERVYFVEEGMASMTTTFQSGSQVEVGPLGAESVVGVFALLGTRLSFNRVYTQIAGSGFSCSFENALDEFKRGEVFQSLCLRHAHTQLLHATQSAGCNARHSIQQRLARWLLTYSDRVDSMVFRISHDFLADMVGSTRPTVSMVAATLKHAGLIRYSRGVITIMDWQGLEGKACECYRLLHDFFKDMNTVPQN